MNDFFAGGPRGSNYDAMYYWDQFQPIIAAVVILLLGWVVALIIAAAVKKVLQKIGTNQKISSATTPTTAHFFDIERIISKVVFWFILIIAVIAALNVLNINSVSGPFSDMLAQVLAFIPSLLAAIAVGFVGWILAKLVRMGLQRVLSRTQLDEKLSSEVGVRPISQNLADIVYWLILLLFLPIVLSILGLNGLLTPVQNMVNEAILFLPNLFIAGVIVFAGYILAKIVRGIVEGLLRSLNLQSQAEKIGLFKNGNLPNLLGSFVFTLIIITALIVAFEALGIEAISQPATAMLYEILNAIPHIIAAGLILIIAYVVSRFVARLVTELVAGTGVDQIPAKLDLQRFLGSTKISAVVGTLIIFFTMLFAVAEAANRLGFGQVSGLISMFIQFGASILLGAVILLIGFWLANMVANVLQRGQYNHSRWLGSLVRVLIMGLVIAMGLRAMGIADSIVNLAFGLTLGAVAVAFALAFGLGGRQPAERLLTELLDKARQQAKQPNPLHPIILPSQSNTTKTSSASSHSVTSSTAPAKSEDGIQDFEVDPQHPPVNNPFGSTSEAEKGVDAPHPPKKDDLT